MAKKKRAQRWLQANSALSKFRLATQPQLSYKQALSAAIGVCSHLDMLGGFLLLPTILPFIAFLDTKLTVADTEDERSQK